MPDHDDRSLLAPSWNAPVLGVAAAVHLTDNVVIWRRGRPRAGIRTFTPWSFR
jgi:homospermidine synthase